MKRIIFASIALISVCGLLVFSLNKNKKAVDITAKNDWTVACDPSQNKAKDEFDVTVIGAGIGGLSCASVLAKKGYKVLVVEQLNNVGGACGSYARNGFTFTVGVEDVSGLHKLGATKMLLDMLELNKDDLFVLNKRLFLLGDKKIAINGTKTDFIKQVSQHFPEEKEAVAAFINEAEQAFVGMCVGQQEQDAYATFLNWKSVTYQEKLDEFFSDPQLKEFMCALLGYLGTAPDKTPAKKALGACLGYFIYGGYYVKGGPGKLAEALKDVVEKNGGKVLTKCRVHKILVENNQVVGVQSGNTVFTSPVVVSNANAKLTFTRLLPQGTLDQDFVETIENLEMSESVFMVQLGVDLDLSHLPSLVVSLNRENFFDLVINSNADATLAPQGKASISIIAHGNYNQTPRVATPEYIRHKEKRAKELIGRVETIIPGLSKHIITKDLLSPRSFERYIAMPEGAIYSFDQSIGNKRPHFKTPVKGLYLTGASTGFGGGVEAVIGTGMRCARDICKSR